MNCVNCQQETSNPKFCSKTCSAIFNNKKPKRKLVKKCKHCESFIWQKNTYCPSCIKQGKHLRNQKFLSDKTLGEELALGRKDANRYNNIRCHARRVMADEPKKCYNCGYEKHVEVCHKTGINDFSLDVTISDINSKENLVLLCPNCHWEFDHNLLLL
jgi:hypothetical protein